MNPVAGSREKPKRFSRDHLPIIQWSEESRQVSVTNLAADPRFRRIEDHEELARMRERLGLPEHFLLFVLQVLSSEEKRRDLIERGLARHRQFSWARCARETLGIYEEVVKSPLREKSWPQSR